MKSKILLATATAGAALLTAACGGSSSSPGAASTPSGSVATSAGAASASGGATSTPATSGTASSSAGAGTGTAGGDPGSLIIGSADFSENTILAYVYGNALAAKGVKVSYKVNIGERAAYMQALKDGSISFIPEYSGSILDYLDTKATAKTPADVAAALKTVAAAANLTPLNYAPAQDADTITVTKATATKYNLTTISSLVPVAGKLTYGAPPNMQTRADGVPGFKAVYGLVFGRFTALSASGLVTQTALKNGSVDAADIFSTDPSIVDDGFVSLTDDKHVFAAQNVVPLVTTSKVTPTITSAANAVSAKLTTLDLAKLLEQVQVKKMDPQAVAKAWDQANGFG
ncbi:MAG: osmoprotectant transport system substrate-binding protein [Frankiales bacterium]|nr:osmoprotectant transport system substrate-binding protein [Frankiales bacterium]MDX6211408.1 osmoprotectant transport system substrate-binding protein [Frankiales bacterium]